MTMGIWRGERDRGKNVQKVKVISHKEGRLWGTREGSDIMSLGPSLTACMTIEKQFDKDFGLHWQGRGMTTPLIGPVMDVK